MPALAIPSLSTLRKETMFTPEKSPSCQTETYIASMRDQITKLEAFVARSENRNRLYEPAIQYVCDQLTDLTDAIVHGDMATGSKPQR